jgi:hypothetical protein
MRGYDDQIMEKNRELSEANNKMQVLNAQLAAAEEACQAAKKSGIPDPGTEKK